VALNPILQYRIKYHLSILSNFHAVRPYLTLTYLTGKAHYHVALKPPVGPMHVPN